MRIGLSTMTSNQSNHKTNPKNQFQLKSDKEINKTEGKTVSLNCINLSSKKSEKFYRNMKKKHPIVKLLVIVLGV